MATILVNGQAIQAGCPIQTFGYISKLLTIVGRIVFLFGSVTVRLNRSVIQRCLRINKYLQFVDC